MKYEYQCPTTLGYRRVRLSKAQHNEIFKYRQITWKDKYEYFLKDDMFIMNKFSSIPVVILSILTFPLSVLYYGFDNFKEITAAHKEILSQKKYGKYSTESCHKGDKYFDEFVAQVKEW